MRSASVRSARLAAKVLNVAAVSARPAVAAAGPLAAKVARAARNKADNAAVAPNAKTAPALLLGAVLEETVLVRGELRRAGPGELLDNAHNLVAVAVLVVVPDVEHNVLAATGDGRQTVHDARAV